MFPPDSWADPVKVTLAHARPAHVNPDSTAVGLKTPSEPVAKSVPICTKAPVPGALGRKTSIAFTVVDLTAVILNANQVSAAAPKPLAKFGLFVESNTLASLEAWAVSEVESVAPIARTRAAVRTLTK